MKIVQAKAHFITGVPSFIQSFSLSKDARCIISQCDSLEKSTFGLLDPLAQILSWEKLKQLAYNSFPFGTLL